MASSLGAKKIALLWLFILALPLAACRQQQISASDIQFELTAEDLRVGETTLQVTVKDKAGAPLKDPGALQIRGDMNHAGMVPVFAQAEDAPAGIFNLPFEWTMAGDWIVEARLELADGTVAQQTFEYEISSGADETGAMAEMDHSAMHSDDDAMEEMDHGASETSAAYMRIHNRGERDIHLVAASSSAAAKIEFHHSLIENNTARMEKLEMLHIPAGETVELQPGGRHIMLMGLTADLQPADKISLQLSAADGAQYTLAIPVLEMLMGEQADALELGDFVFSQLWARPAQAG